MHRKISQLVKDFLWTCAGVDKSILKKDECSTEHAKFVGIGASILLTGVMAFLSGGYAFYIALKSELLAIAIGSIWGMLIFNLDRSIVISLKKKLVESNRSGNQVVFENTVEQFRTSLPRIALSVAIGLTISKPVEIKLFEPEIDARIQELVEKEKEEVDSLAQQKLDAGLKRLSEEKSDLEKQKSEIEKDLELQQSNYIGGILIRGGSDEGTTLRASQIKEYEGQIDTLNKRIAQKDEDIEALKSSSELGTLEEYREIDLRYENANGFLMKFIALENLTSFNSNFEQPNSDLGQADSEWKAAARISWAITLLFILVELLPVLVKILSPYGTYDAMLEEKEKYAVDKEQYYRQELSQYSRDNIDESIRSDKEIRSEINATRIRLRKGEITQLQEFAESSKAIRSEFKKVWYDFFANILKNVSENPQYAQANQKIAKEIVSIMEVKMMEYAKSIASDIADSLEPELKKVGLQVGEETISGMEEMRQDLRDLNSKVVNLQSDIENFSMQADRYENVDSGRFQEYGEFDESLEDENIIYESATASDSQSEAVADYRNLGDGRSPDSDLKE